MVADYGSPFELDKVTSLVVDFDVVENCVN